MSTAEVHNAGCDAAVGNVDMHLEVQIIPVFGVDRSRELYQRLGWRLDDDAPLDGLRIVQFTPPGSGASITFGTGLTTAAPGCSCPRAQSSTTWATSSPSSASPHAASSAASCPPPPIRHAALAAAGWILARRPAAAGQVRWPPQRIRARPVRDDDGTVAMYRNKLSSSGVYGCRACGASGGSSGGGFR
jgi:hypothetical protein